MTTSALPTADLALIIAPRLRSPRGGLDFAGRFYRGGCFLPQAARPALEALAAKAALASIADEVVIGILGFAYRVRSIPIASSVGSVAFLLTPTDRPTQAHHVHRSNEGEVACTCGDFVYRKAGSGSMCKHGRRLAELGLIASTTPRVLPPFCGSTRRSGRHADLPDADLPQPLRPEPRGRPSRRPHFRLILGKPLDARPCYELHPT